MVMVGSKYKRKRRKCRVRSYRKGCKVGIGKKPGYSRQGNARKKRLIHTVKMTRGQLSSFSWLVVRAVERAPLGPPTRANALLCKPHLKPYYKLKAFLYQSS